ncbi:hypothetical protein, partial [Klebsiella michiganensis]|uniref:hypothetical protein n=1 Tax=Klebsiella michiganensis TaxID=1134687 RepID=UPI001B3A5122
ASPPGNSTSLRSAPGAALDAPCPGYGFTAVCQTVARTDAQHRLRECPLPDANRRRPVTLIL